MSAKQLIAADDLTADISAEDILKAQRGEHLSPDWVKSVSLMKAAAVDAAKASIRESAKASTELSDEQIVRAYFNLIGSLQLFAAPTTETATALKQAVEYGQSFNP
jgi:hypothetical protein